MGEWVFLLFFFFNDTATTEIYTLSLHDALPILLPDAVMAPAAASLEESVTSRPAVVEPPSCTDPAEARTTSAFAPEACSVRSEEHTSELQSRQYLVCRLLLENKKKYRE